MTDTAEPDQRSVAVSRAKLVALIAIYAAPLLAAWLWLGYVKKNEGAGVSVNGELIQPARPLGEFQLQDAGGNPWSLSDLREKWSMVYFADDQCDERCETSLYNMRQVRLSTGRRMERVRRVLVTGDYQQMAAKFSGADEGLAVVGGTDKQIQSLRQQIRDAQSDMPDCNGCIFLVDPFANVMMRFPPQLEPGKILKDLKHLLKVSRIG